MAKTKFLIADSSSQLPKYYVENETRFTGDMSTATEFETPEQAQKHIDDCNWNDWAYIETIEPVFYILNTKTDENYDHVEEKFYSNSWTPNYTDDKVLLESLIKNNPEKFKDCKIESV